MEYKVSSSVTSIVLILEFVVIVVYIVGKYVFVIIIRIIPIIESSLHFIILCPSYILLCMKMEK